MNRSTRGLAVLLPVLMALLVSGGLGCSSDDRPDRDERGERPRSADRDSRGTEGPVVYPTPHPAGPPDPPPSAVRTVVVPSKVVERPARYVQRNPEVGRGLTAAEEPEPEEHEGEEVPVEIGWAPPQPAFDPPAAERAAGPSTQGVVTTFNAAEFDTNGTYNGGYLFIPPDNHAAAGPNHVIDVVNCLIEVYNKSGSRQLISSLASFFSGLTPLTFTFDPKVVYDAFNSRWVVVTLEQTTSPSNTSRILLAVSDDSDPIGTWYLTSVNSAVNVSGTDYWLDYPGFAVDEEAIYVTGNLFSFAANASGGVRLFVIPKGAGTGGFYDGGSPTVSLYNPYAGGGIATTTQPAIIRSTAPAGVGTFLVSYSGINDGTNEFLQVVRIDNPLTTPTFTQQYVALGNIDATASGIPGAPQSGTGTTIDAGDRRALSAVWRDGALWATFDVNPASGGESGQSTAHWVKVNTTNLASLALADQGNIGGESITTGAHTFYPSVDVNAGGYALFTFAASSSAIFPGAYYALRGPSDAAGTTRTPVTLQAGTDFYVRKFGGSRNRWGDYTGAAVDPVDGCFWSYNQWAKARGTVISSEGGRWATGYAKVCASPFIGSVTGPIRLGSTVTISGTGFTAGSVIKMFVATASGVTDTGTWSPATQSPTQLTWTPPTSIALGNGFASVYVVNTDESFATSNTVCQNLLGPTSGNPPSIETVNGIALNAADCSAPVAFVQTVFTQNASATFTGKNFTGPLANLFTASGNQGPITPSASNATSITLTIPGGAPTGPGSVQIVNNPYTGNVQSNAVSVPIGALLSVSSVSQTGSTVTVTGTGFSSLSVINLFNAQSGSVVNLGGLNGANPVIPLTNVTPTSFQFQVPIGAESGASYVQVLNPPFIPYTSTGNDPDGAFTMVAT